MITTDFLSQELNFTNNRIANIQKELKKMPAGTLRVELRYTSHDGEKVFTFKHHTKSKGKSLIKGISKNEALVHKLARKEYLEKELELLISNQLILKNMIQNYKSSPETEAFHILRKGLRVFPPSFFKDEDSLLILTPHFRPALRAAMLRSGLDLSNAPENQNLVIKSSNNWNGLDYETYKNLFNTNYNQISQGATNIPLIIDDALITGLGSVSGGQNLLSDSNFRKAWMSSAYPRFLGHPEHLTHPTPHGMVRSKSEQTIVGITDRLGVVSHYEEKVIRKIGEESIQICRFSPDFKYLRYDGKIIYHEHFGRMDDPNYRANREAKLKEYEAFGIVPWDNLIETYDTVDGTIDPVAIEATLRNWLLPH